MTLRASVFLSQISKNIFCRMSSTWLQYFFLFSAAFPSRFIELIFLLQLTAPHSWCCAELSYFDSTPFAGVGSTRLLALVLERSYSFFQVQRGNVQVDWTSVYTQIASTHAKESTRARTNTCTYAQRIHRRKTPPRLGCAPQCTAGCSYSGAPKAEPGSGA